MHKLVGGIPSQFRTCNAHYLARSVGRSKRRFTGGIANKSLVEQQVCVEKHTTVDSKVT